MFAEDNWDVFFTGCFDRMYLRPPVTSESWIWVNEISMCTLPSHSVAFWAVTPLRFESIYQKISLSFNEVERSKFREQPRHCCCQWSKSGNQDHRPVSPSSWERLKLHRSHVGLFWAAAEGRQQVQGLVCTQRRRTPLVPARLKSSLFYCSLWP